jgi:hypothetical protein
LTISPLPPESKGGVLGSGAITGLTLGIVALVAALALIGYVLLKKKGGDGDYNVTKQRQTTRESLLAELGGSGLQRSRELVGTENLVTEPPGPDEGEVWI